jgi:cytochrome P450
MTLFPEAQKKAQSELDLVVGDRLPKFEDMPHLPYMRALVSEILRWHPILPLGGPMIAFQIGYR